MSEVVQLLPRLEIRDLRRDAAWLDAYTDEQFVEIYKSVGIFEPSENLLLQMRRNFNATANRWRKRADELELEVKHIKLGEQEAS